jgi:hypothetical protein
MDSETFRKRNCNASSLSDSGFDFVGQSILPQIVR